MANVGGLSGPITVNPDPVAPGALPNVTGVNPIGASDSAAQQYQAGLQSALTALQQRANAPNMFNVAAGFLTPGPGGFFGELGHASQALAQWQEQQRQMQIPIANLKIQMAINRLAQNKAQEALARTTSTNPADPNAVANTTTRNAWTGSTAFPANPAAIPGEASQAAQTAMGTGKAAAQTGQAFGATPAPGVPSMGTPQPTGAQGAIPVGAAIHALTQIESGGALNPPANAASSARGSGQMISSTLNSIATQLGVDPARYGKDPNITAQMNSTLFMDNAQFLAAHQVPNTMTWNRMAWLLGAPAAAKAAHNPTSAPLSTIVSPAAMAANHWSSDMTVGDLLAQQSAKVQSAGVNPNAPVDLSGNVTHVATATGVTPSAGPVQAASEAPVPAAMPTDLSIVPPQQLAAIVPQLLQGASYTGASYNTPAGTAFPQEHANQDTLTQITAFGNPATLAGKTNNITNVLDDIQKSPTAMAQFNDVVGLVARKPALMQAILHAVPTVGAHVGGVGAQGNLEALVSKYIPPQEQGMANVVVQGIAQSAALEAQLRGMKMGNMPVSEADVLTAGLTNGNLTPPVVLENMLQTLNNVNRLHALAQGYAQLNPYLQTTPEGTKNLTPATTFFTSAYARHINNEFDKRQSSYRYAPPTPKINPDVGVSFPSANP